MKSNIIPYINYTDLESLIKKIDRCASNTEKSSTTKEGEHVLCTSILYIVGKII